LDTCWNFNPNT